MILEHSILIAAPMPIVWDRTVDVERWPEWTPTVTSLKRLDDGPFRCGSAALIRQPGLPEARWVVTAMTPGEQFTWETRVRGMRMIATHKLASQGADTKSVLRLEFRGLTARLLWPLIRRAARRSLEKENAALKALCETLAPP